MNHAELAVHLVSVCLIGHSAKTPTGKRGNVMTLMQAYSFTDVAYGEEAR